ncbi:hypothetical protein CON64_14015 [Bacillus pseudomycoides]|nr:hypothetical protein CON64_14015 [Bacillus pseudomycoides]
MCYNENVPKKIRVLPYVCVNFMNIKHNVVHFVFTNCIVKKDKVKLPSVGDFMSLEVLTNRAFTDSYLPVHME